MQNDGHLFHFMLKVVFILNNFHRVECLLNVVQRVWMKMLFFVSEVSFENVAKVMGFTHAFENGEKCNCLFMSMCFVFFMCLVRLQVKMNVL